MSPDLERAYELIRAKVWEWHREGRIGDANALEVALDIIVRMDREGAE